VSAQARSRSRRCPPSRSGTLAREARGLDGVVRRSSRGRSRSALPRNRTTSCTNTVRRIWLSVTASEARQRLFPLIEQVNDDQAAVEIVSKRGTAFLVSEDEYRSLTETVYLVRSPANAERLRRSLADARAGTTEEHDLLSLRIACTSHGWADCTSWADERSGLPRVNRLLAEALRDPAGPPANPSGCAATCRAAGPAALTTSTGSSTPSKAACWSCCRRATTTGGRSTRAERSGAARG